MRYGILFFRMRRSLQEGGKRKSLGLVVMSRPLGHHIFKLNQLWRAGVT